MKRGGEYSLKGTRGLGERKELTGERKREAEIMKRDKKKKETEKGEPKQRTSMIGKQTSKQARMKDTASLPACTDTCECMC